MATDNFVQPAIPQFYGHYDHWSMLMENFLRSKEYWQVVSDGISVAEASMAMTDARKTKNRNRRVVFEGSQDKELSFPSN